jgi:flagellar basal-body rod protein FlgC
MGLFDAIDVTGSGLSAERLRMDVTSENLANAQTTRGADGQPYRRKEVVLQEAGGANTSFASVLSSMQGRASGGAGVSRGVKVAGIVEDDTALKRPDVRPRTKGGSPRSATGAEPTDGP